MRLLEAESFALCTPTGSGKTLVANLALVKELLLKGDDDGPLALYLVPSRALASEVANDVIVTGLYGGTDWGVTDYWLQGRDDAVPVRSTYRSTRQLIGSFETAPDRVGQMLLEMLNGKPLFVRGRDEPVYISLRTPPENAGEILHHVSGEIGLSQMG